MPREVDVSEFNRSFITNNVDVIFYSDKYFYFIIIIIIIIIIVIVIVIVIRLSASLQFLTLFSLVILILTLSGRNVSALYKDSVLTAQ